VTLNARALETEIDRVDGKPDKYRLRFVNKKKTQQVVIEGLSESNLEEIGAAILKKVTGRTLRLKITKETLENVPELTELFGTAPDEQLLRIIKVARESLSEGEP
jgi:hypothetical protein